MRLGGFENRYSLGGKGVGEHPDEIITQFKDEGLLGNSLKIVPCTEEDAITIAQLRALTKSAGL